MHRMTKSYVRYSYWPNRPANSILIISSLLSKKPCKCLDYQIRNKASIKSRGVHSEQQKVYRFYVGSQSLKR